MQTDTTIIIYTPAHLLIMTAHLHLPGPTSAISTTQTSTPLHSLLPKYQPTYPFSFN